MPNISLDISFELWFEIQELLIERDKTNIEDYILNLLSNDIANSQLTKSFSMLLSNLNNQVDGALFNVSDLLVNTLFMHAHLFELEDLFERYIYSTNQSDKYIYLFFDEKNLLKTYLKK